MQRGLYLDMDGVIADFDSHAIEALGINPRETAPSAFWAAVDAHGDFWGQMPLMPGAKRHVEFLRFLRPVVLTGLPSTGTERAAASKRALILEHFGLWLPVICCASKDKKNAMVAMGDVLVDDNHDNCRRWEKAGGVAVQFQSWPQAFYELGHVFAGLQRPPAAVGAGG